MKSLFSPVVLTLTTALLGAGAARAVDGSPEQCRRLKEQIERYTELRRTGGSASQMASWKRARSEAKAAYRNYNCHRQGSRMVRVKRSG